MTNIDIHVIKKELESELENARVDKAYQPTKDTILIKLHVPGKGRKDLVIQAGKRIHLTQYSLPNPTTPPNFPMLLRKYLKGGQIKQIKQHNFDRILEIQVQKNETYTLIVELFAKGNIILLNQENQIILPLKHKMWHDRKITSKEEYKYPPEKGINPLSVEISQLELIFKESEKEIVKTLASNGIGGQYSEEILSHTDIDKNKLAKEATVDEITEINNAICEIVTDLDIKQEPQIIKDNEDKNIDLIPISLNKYNDYKKETFESFSKAADAFYSHKISTEIKSQEETIWTKQIDKYKKRLSMQEETLDKFHKTIINTQHQGDVIYANYNKIQDIINTILKAREKYSWKEITNIIKKAKKETNNFNEIESINKMGLITLKLDDVTVQIDPKLNIPENTEKYYEKGKKAKRKIDGVNNAMENTKKQIKDLEERKIEALAAIKTPQQRQKKEYKWYEKIRWFKSSDGFFVIGGRDATSNEQVVKNYAQSHDLYFHCDIHGAASVIIQNPENKEIPESSIKQAASFSASYSSAWNSGFSSYDSYYVNLDQVSKTPESGEFLKKGSFVVRGRRNYVYNVPVMLGIGIVEYDDDKRVMAGPVESVKSLTDNFVIVIPGFTKKERISHEILNKINEDNLLGVDDIVRILPAGKCDLLDKMDYERKYNRK